MGKKRLTFEQAKNKILNKFDYLELHEFKGSSKEAKFFDKDYGVFFGIYYYVLNNKKHHPERSKIKRKETNLKKYGVEHPSQNKKVKDRARCTNIKKYGCAYAIASNKVRNKIKKTCTDKYGVDSIFKLKSVQEKIQKTNLKKYGTHSPLLNKFIQEKIRQTNLDRYGVENVFQLQEVKEKIKQTNLDKYGVEHSSQNLDIKEKTKQTNLNRYGHEYVIASDIVRSKIKETNLKRHGAEYPMQNKDILNKQIKTKIDRGYYYNIDGYTLSQYYRQSNLEKHRCFSVVQSNYKNAGNNALNKDYYDITVGKSRVAELWFKTIERQLGYLLIREFKVINSPYYADGYDPKTNTIYEFYGDYWHGYPFKNLGINSHRKISFNTLYYRTLCRQHHLQELGYNVVYIWENDFYHTQQLNYN